MTRMTSAQLRPHGSREVCGLRGRANAVGVAVAALLAGAVMAAAPAEAQTDPLFEEADTYPVEGPGSSSPHGVAIADLNDDNIPDMAVADRGNGSVVVRLGDGQGGFGSAQAFPVGEAVDSDVTLGTIDPVAITAADFTGDDVVDLATANTKGGPSTDWTVSVLPGNGDGTFGTSTQHVVGADPVDIAAADFDSTAKVTETGTDIATANEDDDSVSVLLNNDNGTFERTDYAVGDRPTTVVTKDLDQDGNPDLATPNSFDSTVTVMLNSSVPGQLFSEAAASTYAVGAGPTALTAGDFDGDSDLDLASGNASSEDVSVLVHAGDATGSFEESTEYPLTDGARPWGIVSAELDGDDNTDLAIAEGSGLDAVDVLLGKGDASFQTPLAFSVGDDPVAIDVGDMDNDGDVDLATANKTDETVSVLLNTTAEPQPASVSVEASTAQAAEPDSDGEFTFTRSGDMSAEVTASYAVSGSATPGADYQELPGEVTFPAESTTVTQPVEVIDDDQVEDDETVTATIQDGEAYEVGEPVEATVTIADDDTADEGGAGDGADEGGDGGGAGDGAGDGGGEAAPQPESLSLSPHEATNQVGEDHSVTATVADADGTIVSDVAVVFEVSGANTASGSVATDAQGEASFAYTGETAGEDTITAFADTDGDGSQDDGEPADTAAKTWEPLEEEEEEAGAAAAQVAGSDGPVAACADEFVPTAGFGDVAGSVHESAIDCVAWYAITLGVGDVDGDGQDDYAPSRPVTRDQMASFLARLADEAGLQAPDAPDAFGDDDGSVHEANINTLAALGVTEGKGDVDGDGQAEYAPREPVTRDQMASFLARLADQAGLDVPDDAADAFGDDDGSVHEGNINALAALGISQGKGDVDGDGVDEYAPREPVNRAQMASFIARELGLLVDAGLAEPGGADVDLADESTQGGELSGTVASHKPVAEVVADGCGLAGQALDVAGDGSFTLSIPDDQPAGDCELTVTVTTQRPGVDTGGQTVPYTFDVNVSG